MFKVTDPVRGGPSMSGKRNTYIRGLDGLRAIAITGVVLYHLFPKAFPGGFSGVVLFFSIMGYLLVYGARNELRDRRFSVKRFYEKRIRRLYPALVMTLFAVALLQIPLWGKLSKGSFSENVSVLLGYNNWWQIARNSSYFTRITNASPLTHLWYMGLTMQYYALWPVLLFAGLMLRKVMKRGTVGLLLVLLGIASAVEMGLMYTPGSDPSRVYYGTDTRAFSLLWGMALAMFPAEKTASRLRRNGFPASALYFALLVLTAVFWLFVPGESDLVYRGLMAASNVVFILMMFLVIGWQKSIGRMNDSPFAKWLGSRSYMIYLVMYPVIYFFHMYSDNAEKLVMKLAALAVILAAGELLWRFDRLFAFHPERYGTNRKKARRAAKANRRKIQTVFTTMAVCLLAVSLVQTKRFEASHDTSDMELLEKELEENAAMLEMQIQGGTAAAVTRDHADLFPRPTDTPLPEETPEPEETPLPSQEAEAEITDTVPETVEETPAPVQTYSITAIGDSVMLGAAANMQARFPGIFVNAEKSRHALYSNDAVVWLRNNGYMGDTVIVHLGTNSSFKLETGQQIIDSIGPERTVYWLNCHGNSLYYIGEVNETIRQLAENNANVTMLDWEGLASQHPEWFYSDGIHLNIEGREGYTEFIAQSLGY